MSIELQMLGWSIVLGLAHVLIAATFATRQRGLAWNAGNRDRDVRPLDGIAARTDRASRNFLETFPFFAAALLAVIVADRDTTQTALAAQLYFWARLAYLPIYAAGIPYLRSAVWAVALAGIAMLVIALF